MKYAIKSKRKIINAYCLGSGSQMEAMLLECGAIVLRSDGQYELFSQEAVNGQGQLAAVGDYFKVDVVNGKFYPYPNEREYFLANHDHLSGDTYEQRNKPLAIWQWGDEMFDAVQFLLDNGRLTLDPEHPQRFFNAFLWGTNLSASRNATVVFYHILRSEDGLVTDVSFNFVAKDEFDVSYTLCDAPRN